MELLPILRLLWRRRLWIAAGALLSVGAALLIGPPPAVRAGVATTRVVLDTPDSQLVNTSPKGAESLQWRAALLAHLLAGDEAKARIAAGVGVPTDRVVVIDDLLETPSEPTTLPLAAAEAAATRPEPYAITVRYDMFLPIVSIEAHAPDRAKASALAQAAVVELQSHASSPPGDSATLQGIVVEDVAPPHAKDVQLGSAPVKAVGAGIVAFSFWTAGALLFPALLGATRRRRGRVQPA